MKPIVVITHADHEGPGYFGNVLDRRSIPYHVISIDRGDPLPKRLDQMSAIVSMGGPMSVNDPLPWIADECRLMRDAISVRMPVLGHCLGAQLMSKALGGTITQNPVREIGWFDVTTVRSNETASWLRDVPNSFTAFHWHGETFSIPSGATRLLANAHCANQAFIINNSLALQCHVEMTGELIEDWVRRAPEEFTGSFPAVQSPGEIRSDLALRTRELQRIADVLYDRWLDGLTRN